MEAGNVRVRSGEKRLSNRSAKDFGPRVWGSSLSGKCCRPQDDCRPEIVFNCAAGGLARPRITARMAGNDSEMAAGCGTFVKTTGADKAHRRGCTQH